MRKLFLFALVLSALTCTAQTSKVALKVKEQCDDDPVGKAFVFYFREEVSKSARYHLDATAALEVGIICMDNEVSGVKGVSSSTSVVVTMRMGSCPSFHVLHALYIFGSVRSREKALD